MPRLPIDPKHKADSPFDYPILKLTKNERARIIAIESTDDKGPVMEFVHSLEAPVIANGQVMMEPTETREGTTTTKVKTEFLGRFICSGRIEILSDKARDPDNCSVCKAAEETSAVAYPSRRFAMHIVRYSNLKPSTWEVQAPFAIQVQAWVFADRTYNLLADFKQDVGNLLHHDLLLGPCENPFYQKYDIRPATQRGVWLMKDEFKMQVIEAYKSQQTPYLEALIGRKSREQMEQELQKVLLRSRQAYGGGAATVEETADVVSDADALLSGATIGGDEVPATSAGADTEAVLGGGDEDLAALLGGQAAAPEAPAAPAEPETLGDTEAVTEPETLGGSEDGERASFDDLLSQLPQ